MFTWVYLTIFKLSPQELTMTHIENMHQIAFDKVMCDLIFDSIKDDENLSQKYLKSLAYVKFIDKKRGKKDSETDLIELANIIMDREELLQRDN